MDGDGLREYAGGAKLTITFEYLDFETRKAITMELVRDYWREVGVDVRLKSEERSLQSERAQANRMQMTLWHADKVTDIIFPLVPDWFYPHRLGWDIAMWIHWARYYQTEGELGEEPPLLVHNLRTGATSCAKRPRRSIGRRRPRRCLRRLRKTCRPSAR